MISTHVFGIMAPATVPSAPSKCNQVVSQRDLPVFLWVHQVRRLSEVYCVAAEYEHTTTGTSSTILRRNLHLA
jgi:hypothetical protein